MPTIRLDQETKQRIKNAPVAGMTFDEKVRSLLDQSQNDDE